jgi:hypothetical protein
MKTDFDQEQKQTVQWMLIRAWSAGFIIGLVVGLVVGSFI